MGGLWSHRFRSSLTTRKLKEQHKREKERQNQWGSEGVIEEEAAQRCGSKDALMAAVSRGSVRVVSQCGMTLFVFPRANSTMAERVPILAKTTNPPPKKHTHTPPINTQEARKKGV